MRHAPAKINLHLELRGIRPDGYHEIGIVFAPLLDLYDEVSVEKSPNLGIEIQYSGRIINLPAGVKDLCVQAAETFCQEYGIVPSHRIYLNKNIPVSAGLGGGSSDAAAVLLELCYLHNQDAGDRKLKDLAAKLGADVPFFLNPGIMKATGIGEILTPVFDIPGQMLNRNVAIIYPKFPSPVSTAYKLADKLETRPSTLDEFTDNLKNGIIPKFGLRNDLGDALQEKFPILDMIADELTCGGMNAPTVSGSGSSIFAFLPEKWNDFFEKRIIDTIGKHFNVEIFFSRI